MRHLSGHKAFALVLAGLFVVIGAMTVQAQTDPNLIRNSTFEDPAPFLIGPLPPPWTGGAGIGSKVESVDPTDPRFVGIGLDSIAVAITGSGLLQQPVWLTAAGLAASSTVRSATLQLRCYNPETELEIKIHGSIVGLIPHSSVFGSTSIPLAGIDLKDTDSFTLNAVPETGTDIAVVDDIVLIPGEVTTGGGGDKTPVPPSPETPVPTPTVTETGTPTPTPTISPTPTGTPVEATPTPEAAEEAEAARYPVAINVTANPSLLLLPPGGDLLTVILGESGVESTIVVELVGSDGSRMPILHRDKVTAVPIGLEEVGTVDSGDLRDDGTYEFTFKATSAGTAVYQVTLERPEDPESGGKRFFFTDVVNIMIKKDRSESILGGEGTARARINPPKNRTIYFDRSE